jgi:two-component system chemotaxis response regulator CheB
VAAKIRVLIIDDSAFTRQVLTGLLDRDPAIEVVGTAADPLIAWDKIRQVQPDVLTLDVEMPRMDGLTFLRRLMQEHPLPVVMVSSLTRSSCEVTLEALELGAVDYVCKPESDIRERLPEIAQEVIDKIKMAAAARPRRYRGTYHGLVPALVRRPAPLPGQDVSVVALGASTGGTEAISEFLLDLPADFPGMVIVQHMPPKFTRAFAERLNQQCLVRVKEAETGDAVLLGHVLIAPGDYHMQMVRDGTGYRVRLNQEAPVNRHRPSVDVLFQSCAATVGAQALGILLTGMGEDGARGLLEMRRAGAYTLAQDEATSVVFGMPKAAIDLGAVQQVLPLYRLAATVVGVVQDRRRRIPQRSKPTC